MPDVFTLPLLEWCDIPAGWVTIEWSAHWIPVSKDYHVEAFHISKYPVTYAQFQVFLDAADGFRNDAWWRGLAANEAHRSAPGKQEWPVDNHPRENVSWYDAVAFCRRLSDKTGLIITLPTEAQWQRAAQGDDGREYPWGDEFDSSRCNTEENGINRTTPVNQYPSGISPYGVYDMAGNVWEWCLNETKHPEITRIYGSDVDVRVARGCPYFAPAHGASLYVRFGTYPIARWSTIGFRVVCVPPSAL